MSNRVIWLSAAAGLALNAQAMGAQFEGWYVGIEGGGSWIDPWEFSSIGPTSTTIFGSEFDAGWMAAATLGYSFENNWRFELEGAYRFNQADRYYLKGFGPGGTPFGPSYSDADEGSLGAYSVMANVLHDFQLSDSVSLTIGAGSGADRARLHLSSGTLQEWNFAAQGLAGLNFKLDSTASLFVNYRYMRVLDTHFIDAAKQNDDFEKNSVSIGLRFGFAQPAEAPMAIEPVLAPEAVAPPPPRQFIIFFGYNKCSIAPSADAVLTEAASAAKTASPVQIKIVGHTDSAGSTTYNQSLSECRANAAKSNLVTKGVNGAAIVASGRGEGELLIQTADGMKEPQNRRATIDF